MGWSVRPLGAKPTKTQAPEPQAVIATFEAGTLPLSIGEALAIGKMVAAEIRRKSKRQEPDLMDDSCFAPDSSSRIVSGALAYLCIHMESPCPRAAYLASLALNRIAEDPGNDAQLRQQAQKLAEILENASSRYNER